MPMFDKLGLAQKFAILGGLVLVMVALPAGLLLQRTRADVQAAWLEAAGMAPLQALQKVVQLTQQHRGVAAGMLGGNEALTAKRPAVHEALQQALLSFDARLKDADVSAPLLSRWAEHKKTLAALEQAVAERQLKPAESSARHTALIAIILSLNDQTLDEFGLALDPQVDS